MFSMPSASLDLKVPIHSLTGKLPEHKNGWTPPVYKYMGPYNPLNITQEHRRSIEVACQTKEQGL